MRQTAAVQSPYRISGLDFDRMAKPNFKDNLEFLRAMNSHTVHLIATDPPFKKGRDFHATPDSLASGASFQDRWSWEKDVHEEWVSKIKDDFPTVWEVIDAANAVYMRKTRKNLLKPREEVGSDMGAFLCFMAVRLLEMHRVLRADGSLYLHCDPTASHFLRTLLDAIFGWRNFRNEIVWCYGAGHPPKRDFARKHDVIFRYTKSAKYYFDSKDPALRVSFNKTALDMHFKKKDKDGRKYRLYASGRRSYEDEGKAVPDYWTDIDGQKARSPLSKEYTGYPTQKPLQLYERIIKASSRPGDIVLDPFCGCATTLIAAERLQRNWVGMDIWEGAHVQVVQRLKRAHFTGDKIDEADWFGGKRSFQFDTADITYATEPPERTDDGDEAVPFLLVRERVREPRDVYSTNAERRAFLLKQYGPKCQGCDRVFDDPRYLELDHNTPRSTGGWNHISNRILLCGPCNRLKSNIYTLIGLRRENKKRGYMAKGKS